MAYAIKAASRRGFQETVERTRAALAEEGFGVMSEIDVQAKMKERLDRDMEPYLILGACAPWLAWQGLQAQPDLGVLLPCNVCIYVLDGQVTLSAMEPKAALPIVGDPRIDEIGEEVSGRLHRVVAAVAA